MNNGNNGMDNVIIITTAYGLRAARENMDNQIGRYVFAPLLFLLFLVLRFSFSSLFLSLRTPLSSSHVSFSFFFPSRTSFCSSRACCALFLFQYLSHLFARCVFHAPPLLCLFCLASFSFSYGIAYLCLSSFVLYNSFLSFAHHSFARFLCLCLSHHSFFLFLFHPSLLRIYALSLFLCVCASLRAFYGSFIFIALFIFCLSF